MILDTNYKGRLVKTIVKGSKLHPVRVVEYRPLRKAVMVVMVLLFVASGVCGSYFYGKFELIGVTQDLKLSVANLSDSVQLKEARIEELEQQLTNATLGAEVDRSSSESVRKDIADLKDEVARLEEDNSFYRSLMAPTENARGLTLGAVEISRSTEARLYSYRIVVQQLVTKHLLLSGYATFSIVGKLNGETKSYSLFALSEQVDAERIKLKFKYFQTIAGELKLPENFEPDHIELTAQSHGAQSQKVEKKFAWLVEEK